MADPNWSDFRVILALSKSGSVAGAARLLGVDASTVSRRLAAAEQAFGATLIVRGGGDFRFTAEGLAILKAAETMEATVDATRINVRAMREEPTGIVRIACVPTALHFLRHFAEPLAVKYPGLQIELMSARAVIDIGKGEADISIRTAEPKDLDLVVAHKFTWGSCIYGARDYLEAKGWPKTPEDLRGHKLIRYSPGVLHLRAFGWIEDFADPAAPAVRVENSDSARVMIEQGQGLGPLFCAVGDDCPTLARVFPEPYDQIGSWIVYHESARGSSRIRTVLDELIAFHEARLPLLTGEGGPLHSA